MSARLTPIAHPLHDPTLRDEIAFHVDSLSTRYAAVFPGGPHYGSFDRTALVDSYVSALQHMDIGGEVAAQKIANHLVDPSFPADPAWWARPLGRAVAWHLGYYRTAARLVVAEHLLRLSRQRVAQMWANFELGHATPDNNARLRVTAESLRDELRRRAQ